MGDFLDGFANREEKVNTGEEKKEKEVATTNKIFLPQTSKNKKAIYISECHHAKLSKLAKKKGISVGYLADNLIDYVFKNLKI